MTFDRGEISFQASSSHSELQLQNAETLDSQFDLSTEQLSSTRAADLNRLERAERLLEDYATGHALTLKTPNGEVVLKKLSHSETGEHHYIQLSDAKKTVVACYTINDQGSSEAIIANDKWSADRLLSLAEVFLPDTAAPVALESYSISGNSTLLVTAFPKRLLLHGLEPGQDLQALKKLVEENGFHPRDVGFEIDITEKRGNILAESRDAAVKERLKDLLDRAENEGFQGLYKLDILNRRAVIPAFKFIENYDGAAEIVLAPERTMLHFVDPGLTHHYKSQVDPNHFSYMIIITFESGVTTRYSEKARVAEWEPRDDDQYRIKLLPAMPGYQEIFYRTPYESYTAKFDLDECARRDIKAFALFGVLDKIVPYGKLENILRFREIWEEVMVSIDQDSVKNSN